MRLRRSSWHVARPALLLASLAALTLLLPMSLGAAESMPRRAHWSADRRFVLRASWEHTKPRWTAWLTLKERHAHGWLHRWTVRSPVGTVPQRVDLTDGGTAVLLHQSRANGHEKKLAFISATGEVLATYTLDQILRRGDPPGSDHTFGEVLWMRDGLFILRERQTQFAFLTQVGSLRVFNLATGRPLPASSPSVRAFRREALGRARAKLGSRDPKERLRATALVAALRDAASVPRLKRLLDDPWTPRKGVVLIRRRYHYYPVYPLQLAAADALYTLLGSRSLPLLRAKQASANPTMREYWADGPWNYGGFIVK
jgi:hypothetical protein